MKNYLINLNAIEKIEFSFLYKNNLFPIVSFIMQCVLRPMSQMAYVKNQLQSLPAFR